jgi:hypothetical protein
MAAERLHKHRPLSIRRRAEALASADARTLKRALYGENANRPGLRVKPKAQCPKPRATAKSPVPTPSLVQELSTAPF